MLHGLMDRVKRRWLVWALKKTEGNKTQAADLLGIAYRTVSHWCRRYKVNPSDYKRRGFV